MSTQAEVFPTASRKFVIATRVFTIVMTAIWVFFGVNWMVRSKDVLDAMSHLGFPLYMTYAIGLTHILGGLGLLISHRPKVTQWVFAGLTYDLILAAISHIASHDVFTNALHPIVLIIFQFILLAMRDKIGDNLWGSRS